MSMDRVFSDPRYPASGTILVFGEILAKPVQKNLKFVGFYLKRLFDISIFGKKIYFTMDVGYVNK